MTRGCLLTTEHADRLVAQHGITGIIRAGGDAASFRLGDGTVLILWIDETEQQTFWEHL